MTRTIPCSIDQARGNPGDVHVVSPAPRDVWRELLAADPTALPTQTPQWTDWLCRTRGYSDASRLYRFPTGRQLLLPLVGSTVAGVHLTEESMPYGFGYGGLLAAGGPPREREVRAVLADLAQRRRVRTSLVPDPLTSPTWESAAPAGAVRVPFLSHVLDLDGGFGHVWSTRYSKETRKNVRRATRQGLDVRRGRGSDIVDAFHLLNQRSVDRWAQNRGQPLWLARAVERRRDRVGQLASAVRSLGDVCEGWVALSGGEPVAVHVFLQHGERTYSWLSAMDHDLARRTRAGTLLLSLAIEEACAAGARRIHLGESDPGSGVSTFKERFGGVPVPWSALSLERLPVTTTGRRLRMVAGRLTARRRVPTGGAGR